MAEIGESAALGKTPPQTAMDKLSQLLRSAPLQPQPMLVEAAIVQRSGDFKRAETLLIEARRRDPRSAPARYLLAEGWLAQGRLEEGLGEMAILARLMPGSAEQLAPALSQYARTPGASRQIKRMIRDNPKLKRPLLEALSADPGNVEIVLDLAGGERPSAGEPSPPWQRILLAGLVRQQDYERAYALWRRLTGFSGPRPLLFNPGFERSSAPPPFNWDFKSNSAGVAEPGEGRMRVLFYGRDNTTLTSQLLLLPPGSYRFSAGLSGIPAPEALYWQMICLPQRSGPPLLDLPLSTAKRASAFAIPSSGCKAQLLELKGRATDSPQPSDLLVGPATIERASR